MTDALQTRLDQILPMITSTEVLAGRGLGNEIGFYIFEYPPVEELRLRDHLAFLRNEALPGGHPGLRVKFIDLFALVIDYLKSRRLLDTVLKKQDEEGDAAALKALEGPLHESRIAPFFVEAAQPGQHDLVIVHGVGKAFPLLRTHTLLNNLHPLMGGVPLMLFFPGRYDGHALALFNDQKDKGYYRAFRLVP
jgi:hypothetical protein